MSLTLLLQGPQTAAPLSTADPTFSPTVGVQPFTVLTATPGTWSGTPTFTYQWERTSGAVWASISGATASTYTVTAADVGSKLRIAVTATNAAGSSTAYSHTVVLVTDSSVTHLSAPPPTLKLEVDFVHDPLTMTYQQVVLSDTPHSYYRLNDPALSANAVDYSGNGRTGTYSDASLFTYRFAGPITGDPDNFGVLSSSGAFINTYGPADGAGNGFSFECWLYPTGTGSSNGIFMCDPTTIGGDSGVDPTTPYLGWFASGTVFLFDPAGSSAYGGYSGFNLPVGSVPANTWSYISLTWGGSYWILRRGGTSGITHTVGAPGITTNIDTYSGLFWVGGYYNSARDYRGGIDEVAFYNYELSGDQSERRSYASVNAPSPVPTWTDQTSRARSFTISRGRQVELDEVVTGTMTAELKDMSRDLEPEYAASPYYPNVVPMRRTRVTANYSGVARGLFDGYIETFPISWSSFRYTQIELSAFDALGAFANWTVSGLLPYQSTGMRVHTLLNKIGWNTAARAVDGGTVAMREKHVTEQSLLGLLQECAATEDGVFFIDSTNDATFHDSAHRTSAPRSVVSQATFGDGAPSTGQLPYLSPEPSYDVNRIYNHVAVSYWDPVTGLEQQAEASNIPSQFRYGKRSYQRSTELTDAAVAAAKAAAILARLKDPHLRFDSVTLEPKRAASLWLPALTLEISDRITVVRQPYAGGAPLSKDCFVERVSHAVTTGSDSGWITTLSLSPV
jgi:hypothetical protein